MTLHPCDACGRHVRAGTASCPFCDAALSPMERPAPRTRPLGQITRAAIFAGTALLLAPACGPSRDDPDNIAQPYGAPPDPGDGDEVTDDGAGSGSGTETNDDGSGSGTGDEETDIGIAPPYGTPPAGPATV